MTVNDFLLDFAVASVFIMLGQLLRAKIKFFQRFFIPASMLLSDDAHSYHLRRCWPQRLQHE